MSGYFWLLSGNVTALRLAVVRKTCVYSSAPDTVTGCISGVVEMFAVRCPWLCCPM